jgi:hypothetical protein
MTAVILPLQSLSGVRHSAFKMLSPYTHTRNFHLHVKVDACAFVNASENDVFPHYEYHLLRTVLILSSNNVYL